jgi:heavy metal sensor kinase
MSRRTALAQFTRGLRFRLTLSYVLFFTVLLCAVGLFFRHALSSIMDSQVREVLDEEWAAVNGYLRVVNHHPLWFYDEEDPEERAIVERLRRVFLLADAQGKALEVSGAYEVIGIDPPQEIRAAVQSRQPVFRLRTSAQGLPYMIRGGVLNDERHSYYVAVGRPLADSRRVLERFTLSYFALTPVMILSSGLLGWALAGRALRPVDDVSRAARRISGENLSLRIGLRGAGDELDELIGAFNLMLERLESSFEQIRRFSIDVSHELRTPITAIRGQLEVALLTAQSQEQYREAIVNAMQDIERLSNVVRALLLLSQAESGHLPLSRTPLDMVGLVRDIVDEFQIPAEGARLTLTAELPAQCRAVVDRVQMERLVSNLLSNAVKYTPAGGQVRVRLARLDGEVTLSVADTGRGIAAEHLPHIFERFYREPQEGEGPERGAGLGLSFVAWIVKAHGGRVDVTSEPGKGSCFTVRFPAGAPDL